MKFRGQLVHGTAADDHVIVRFNISRIMQSRQAMTVANEVSSAVQRYDAKVVVMDFTGVRQISSEMLGKLLQIKKFMGLRPEPLKAPLRICGLDGSIERLFKVSRFDRIFPAFPTAQDALEG